MRILAAQNLIHTPAHGGVNRSSRIMLEQLAARGHECHVVAPMSGAAGGFTPEGLARWLGDRPSTPADGMTEYDHGGVRVHSVWPPARLARQVRQVIAGVRPDWVLVPSDDPGLMVLGAALDAAPDRVVYCVHTVQQVPFELRRFGAGPTGTDLVRRTAARISVSRAAQEHLTHWAGLDSDLIRPHVYGAARWPARKPGGSVLMVNPSAYKGIGIFLGLADAFPRVPFSAVPTGSTTDEELVRLRRRPNVTVLPATDRIDDLYDQAAVVLMPSLWDEPFGYTTVEAMLRGIPVLAADVGGLSEAKLGVPHLLPVRTIRRYGRSGTAHPEPVVPAQDLRPWRRTLGGLLADPVAWRELSDRSRRAARRFVNGLDDGALASYLSGRAPVGAEHPDPVRRCRRSSRTGPEGSAGLTPRQPSAH